MLPHPHNFVLHLLTNPAPSALLWPKTLHVKLSDLVFFHLVNFAVGLHWICVILFYLTVTSTALNQKR